MEKNKRSQKVKLIFVFTIIGIIGFLSLYFVLTSFSGSIEKIEKNSELSRYTTRPEINMIELEQQIHQLVNEIRIENGVKPLGWDETISMIARKHSINMIERDYFGHESPEGNLAKDRGFEYGYKFCGDENIVKMYQDYDKDRTELFEQLANLGISDEHQLSFYPELWTKYQELENRKNELREIPQLGSYGLSENLFKTTLHKSKIVADNKTIGYIWKTFDELSEQAIEGWLNSTTHRETMLRNYWTVEGIGVAIDGNEWLIVTQNFC